MDDSVKLIRNCDLGAKMGIIGINSALHYVTNPKLMDIMEQFKDKHRQFSADMNAMLRKLNGDSIKVNPIMKAMNTMTTKIRISIRPKNEDIAQMMMNSCDKGIRKVADNMIKYKNADQTVKDMAKRLVALEQEYKANLRLCV